MHHGWEGKEQNPKSHQANRKQRDHITHVEEIERTGSGAGYKTSRPTPNNKLPSTSKAVPPEASAASQTGMSLGDIQ